MKKFPWQKMLLLVVASNLLTLKISLQTRVMRKLTTVNPPSSLVSQHQPLSPQIENKRANSNPRYRLASEHSLGFFDDIDHRTWEVHRLQALTTPHYVDLAFPGSRSLVNNSSATWLYNNWIPNFSCPRLSKVGGLGDGPKWTCDVDRLARVVDRRRKLASDEQKKRTIVTIDDDATDGDNQYIEYERDYCLVYSIGSNGDYSFEDSLVSAVGPICEIHIFDPGNFERSGLATHNMFYHRWGLTSSYQHSNFLPDFLNGLEMYSFSEIRRKLGHENRTIDIMKIDCEGCEWYVSHKVVQGQREQRIQVSYLLFNLLLFLI
jgi:hypothetical protein